jgi:hypothetical protein
MYYRPCASSFTGIRHQGKKMLQPPFSRTQVRMDGNQLFSDVSRQKYSSFWKTMNHL